MDEGSKGNAPKSGKNNHRGGNRFRNGMSHAESTFGHYFLPTILIAGLVFLLQISATSFYASEVSPIPGEHILEIVVGYAVLMCELFAAAVIAIAAIQGMVRYLRTNFRQKPILRSISDVEANRLRMGHRLSLGLEFAVAADILRLAISPKVSYLLVVFAIILLRVLLNYFLEHDSQTIRECHYVEELDNTNTDEFFDPDSEDCCG